MTFPRFILAICFALVIAGAPAAFAQEHAPAPAQGGASQPPAEGGAQPAHSPQAAAEHGEAAEEHPSSVLSTVARLFNFTVLVGALVYFLRAPIAAYLASRGTVIRQELVTAAELRASASAQLAEIQAKMSALPGELEALRRQGAEDVKAEEARIAEAAVAERKRLLDQTRREIETRLRIAKRELTEHAAQLAVQVAETRIKRGITADDQIRLVDRYASQLKEAR
jgi:F-type H+-transporting ATPase subunit b